MSSIYVKTKYNTEGPWGSVDEKTIYAHHHLTCDIVSFYDEDGDFIMSVPDTLDNNMLDAINRLYRIYDSDNILADGVEYLSMDEYNKLKNNTK